MVAGQGLLLLCMLPLLSCGLTDARRRGLGEEKCKAEVQLCNNRKPTLQGVRAGRTERGILDEIQELKGALARTGFASHLPGKELLGTERAQVGQGQVSGFGSTQFSWSFFGSRRSALARLSWKRSSGTASRPFQRAADASR